MRGVLAFGSLAFLRLSALRFVPLALGDKDEALRIYQNGRPATIGVGV